MKNPHPHQKYIYFFFFFKNRDTIQVKTHAQILLKKLDEGYDIFEDLDNYNRKKGKAMAAAAATAAKTVPCTSRKFNPSHLAARGNTDVFVRRPTIGPYDPLNAMKKSSPSLASERILVAKALLQLSSDVRTVGNQQGENGTQTDRNEEEVSQELAMFPV